MGKWLEDKIDTLCYWLTKSYPYKWEDEDEKAKKNSFKATRRKVHRVKDRRAI